VARYHALNDAVLHSMALARLTRLLVRVDGEPVTSFRADGAIVATPTGSTAYSMACDGPIVLPSMDALLFTPICAHPLTLRPLVVPATSSIEVEVGEPRQKTMLTVDGQIGLELSPGDVVRVRRRHRRFRLAQLATTSYFSVLREKLRW
jgi:NAD+ kinase